MKRLLIIALAVVALCVLLAGSPFADWTGRSEATKNEGGAVRTGGTEAGDTGEEGAPTGGVTTAGTKAGSDEPGAAAAHAGEKVFMEAQCHLCHTVYSSGIGEPAAEGADGEGGSPDLSCAGVGRTAEWMSLYMKKRATMDDEKHLLSFSGSDEELAALVDWLMTLRPADAGTSEPATAETTDVTTEEADETGEAGKGE